MSLRIIKTFGNMFSSLKSWVAPQSNQFVPVVTFGLILVSVLFYLFGKQDVFSAKEFWEQPLRLFSHQFSHGSPNHLLFNMFMLVVIGPPVEKTLGKLKYILLYLLSGAGAAFLYGYCFPGGGLVGASGAIAGIMAAYPFTKKNTIGFLFPLFLVGFYFFTDFQDFIAQLKGQTLDHIAHVAHLGGGVAGLILFASFRRTSRH